MTMMANYDHDDYHQHYNIIIIIFMIKIIITNSLSSKLPT